MLSQPRLRLEPKATAATCSPDRTGTTRAHLEPPQGFPNAGIQLQGIGPDAEESDSQLAQLRQTGFFRLLNQLHWGFPNQLLRTKHGAGHG